MGRRPCNRHILKPRPKQTHRASIAESTLSRTSPKRKQIRIVSQLRLNQMRGQVRQPHPQIKCVVRAAGGVVAAAGSARRSRAVSNKRRRHIRQHPQRLLRHLQLFRRISRRKELSFSPSGCRVQVRARGSSDTTLPRYQVTSSVPCCLTTQRNSVFKTWSFRIFGPC